MKKKNRTKSKCVLKVHVRICIKEGYTWSIKEKLQYKWCVTNYNRDLMERPWTYVVFSWCPKNRLRVDDLTG